MNSTQRLFFIDNLRVLLIFLVVAFHAAAPYAEVPWYTIPPQATPLSAFVLSWLLAVCGAFFLSLFFMIAGYFTPHSYDLKGARVFWRDRLVRLGIPFVVFFLGVMPLFSYTLHVMDTPGNTLGYWEFLASHYHWETHHLWFLSTLLILTGGYGLWRLVSREPEGNLSPPGNFQILAFVVLLSMTTFLVRIWCPVGRWDPLKLVEPAYLPQFGGLFMIGIIAYRRQWMATIPTSVGQTWLRIGLASALLFPVVYVASKGEYTVLIGKFRWQPFVFSVWEVFVCVGLCVGLVILFRERAATQKELGKILAADTYSVYLVHLPVVVSLQRALIDVNIHPLSKFALVVLMGVPLSFLAGHYMRKLPCAKRIL
jgi:glucan biosynthesis protein C